MAKSQPSTLTLTHSSYVQVQKNSRDVSSGSTPSGSQCVDVLSQLFFPSTPNRWDLYLSLSLPRMGPVNASNNGNADIDIRLWWIAPLVLNCL
jgi:hypothetical protein